MRVLENGDSLEIVLGSVITTTQPSWVADWVIASGPTFVQAKTDKGLTNGTTPVTMVTGTVVGQQLRVMTLSIYNRDTITHSITVRRDSTTPIIQATIAVGGSLHYDDGKGWSVRAANGVEQYIGATGPAGPAGPVAAQVSNETPSGLVDGSNATFTTAYNFVPELVEVNINGLTQKPVTHYSTSSSNTILFGDSPIVGDQILVNYVKV